MCTGVQNTISVGKTKLTINSTQHRDPTGTVHIPVPKFLHIICPGQPVAKGIKTGFCL